jgi:hypothetical protein
MKSTKYTDSLTVKCDDTVIKIPLTAMVPSPDIMFESLANLGFCVPEVPVSHHVVLTNKGTREGSFNITWDEKLPFRITPSSGKLAAGRKHIDLDGDGRMEGDESFVVTDGSNQMTVTIDFEATELGPFRALAEVNIEGEDIPKILDITAQSVEQRLELVHSDNSGALGELLKFGPLIYGQEKQIDAMLVNNGPQPISYTLTAELDKGMMEDLDRADGGSGDFSDVPDGNDNATAITDDDNPIYKTLTVYPTEGIIEPFAQLPVAFKFSPNYSKKKSGFNAQAGDPEKQPSRNFAVKVLVEGAEIKAGNELELHCTGKAVRPNVELSQSILRFGECPVYDRRDILLTVKNTSELPLPYKFDKLPNFQARPPSGTLKPMQSQSCVVSFAPGQMGDKKNVMNLTLAGGLAKLPIRCMGQAKAAPKGAKKMLTGGPNSQPADFRPTFNFVKSEKADEKKARTATGKWTRAQPWEEMDLLTSSAWDESKAGSAPTDLKAGKETFSLQKLAANAEHKKKYDSFLTQAAEERSKKKAEKKEKKFQAKFGSTSKYDPSNPDLGMDRDVEEPMLPLPEANEGLWLQRPLDGTTPAGGVTRLPVDENRLISKKFKPAPTTQAEVRDCEAELTSQELLGVHASHKVIDFGEVVVNSVTAKNFAVSNDLPRCVLVAMGKLDNEVEASVPASQVIPSGATAGFDITFQSAHEGKFKKSVQWIVNSKHTFKFTILAQVVPVSILLNTQELKMSFSDQSLDSSVSEIVTMENPGNAPAEFLWTSRRAFTVKPERGEIPAWSTAEVEVTWTPSPAYKNAEVLNLHVPGGEDVELSVEGQIQEARCKFAQQELDCGMLAVGIESEHTVKLKNVGKSPAVVSVDNFPEGTGIVCKPDKARIAPGQFLEFKLTIKPPMPRKYEDISMGLSVRGGKMLRMPIICEAVVPKVVFEEEKFDFEKVVIGNRIRMPVTLKNEGTIPASLQLDMSKFPDFTFHEPKKARFGSAVGSGFADSGSPAVDMNSLDPVLVGRGDDDEVAHRWKITVGAGSTFNLEFEYKPSTVTTHDFQVPLRFQGIPTDSSLKRDVVAVGVKPRLIMSSTVSDFEDKVVQRDPGRRIPYTKELTFKNDSKEGISWNMDDASLRPVSTGDGGNITATSIWFVSPKFGNLTPGETVTIRVTFSPQEDADYENVLPIYLADQEDKTRPYLNLTLRGCGVYPRITFNVEDVLLPTVPLNVVSRAKFWLINDGYDNLDVTHKLPLNCTVPLDVEFPMGTRIGIGNEKVPVIISYSSDKPISLNTKLEFFDADGSSYSINLIGCSDNSVFTNYPFIKQYADNYKYFTMDGSPVVLYDKKQVLAMQQLESKRKEADRLRKRKETEKEMAELAKAQQAPNKKLSKKEKEKEAAEKAKAAKGNKAPPPLTTAALLQQTDADEKAGIDVEAEAYKMGDDDIDVLKGWLNANVMVAPIKNFPGDFLDTNGKAGIDAIEMMCGKKVPGKVKKLTSVKADQWTQLNNQYKELLLFMKQNGGLLAGVRSENLLQRNQFVAAREDEAMNGPVRVTAAQLKARKAGWEQNHGQINREAWAVLMYQAIRVFVLGRVTPVGLSKLPGVLMPATSKGKGGGKKSIDSELEGSNLYTLGESCLLKWVSYHVKASMTNSLMKKRIVNFESDFADGSVFCHLLASHLPHLAKEEGQPLFGYTPCTDTVNLEKPDIRLANCKKVMEVLKICKIDFGISVEALMSPNARQTVMWVLHMYQALPQLIPKTSIDFNCTLGDTMRKSIALTNPSSKPISYAVTLDGCDDFSTELQHISLDPKSVTQFIVSLTPRFSKPQEARLTFWSQKDGGPMASNLVFLLKSNVSQLKAVESYKVDGKCFEVTTVDVKVKNPYEKSCTFFTEIQQSLSTPFNGVPGVNFLTPQQIFGPALARNKSRKRLGTSQSSRGGLDAKAKEEAEAAAQELEDKKKALELLGSPFYVPESTKIKLSPGEETTITIQVLAFVPGTYKGFLILLDENVGQFCYEVVGSVGLPPPSADLSFDVNAEEGSMEQEKILKIPARNGQIDRAAGVVLDRMASNIRTRMRNVLMSFLAPAGPEETNGLVRYRCTMDSPFFQGSPDVIMKGNEFAATLGGGSKSGTPSTGRRGGGGGSGSKTATLEDNVGEKPLSNFIALNFYPKEAGDYSCTVMMMPFTGEPDLRIYTISSKVVTAPKETSLDFRAPARQVITQDIPISNNGAEDWTLSCVVGGSKCFSGSNSFKVPANSTAAYPLSFKPAWLCEEEGTLTMKNAKAGNSFVFNLHGIGEAPLAEGNLQYKCKAREEMDEVIPFPQLGAQDWSVETDLPYVTGSPTFVSGGEGYKINIKPQTGGTFNGQITFTNEKNGQYVWYTVDMFITAPAAEAQISIKSECRKASVATISLANPTDGPIVFDVRLDGEGLLGDRIFQLEPNTKSSYELYYSPLIAGKHEGTVAFTNEQAGEFWYELELTATAAPPVTMSRMTCPVGGKCKTKVWIQNPLGKEVKMGSSVNNKRNFAVSPGAVILPPYGEGSFDIVYTPSSLGEEEMSRIDVTHPELGNYVYLVSGVGGMPGLMDEEHCPVSVVHDQTTYPFRFRNPFNAALTVDLILETDEEAEKMKAQAGLDSPSGDSFASSVKPDTGYEVFKLLPKTTREIVMAPFTSIQVPISFSPDNIEEKGARLIIRGEIGMKKDLVWIYNIRGLAEAPAGNSIVLKCAAKSNLKQEIKLGLYGLADEGMAERGEEFVFGVEYPTCTDLQKHYLKEWLYVVGDNLKLRKVDGLLTFQFLFNPLRPFTAGAELIVIRKSTGGRWKFPIRVDVGDAEPEDQPIIIEAAIKTVKKVVFRMNNRTQEPAKFQAFFTVDSANTLHVEPSGGVLEPYGTDGTEFTLSYAPMEYGKAEKGKLIIQTEECQWIYDVVTKHPGYSAPDNVPSKLDNRLDPQLEKSLGTSKLAKKNIIAENMKAKNMMAGKIRNDKAKQILSKVKDLPEVER